MSTTILPMDVQSMDVQSMNVQSMNIGGNGGGLPQMAYEDGTIMGYELKDWFSARWLKRIQLTINPGKVLSTQTDYPLLINRIIPELIGMNYVELRFTDVNNTQLDYEIEFVDEGTGKLIAWVKKPILNDGDIINIYYDNPDIELIDEQNPQAVWSDYQYVAHLSDTPGGAGSIIDSSPNSVNGTPNGVVSVPGKIGDALSFDGIDDFVDLGLIEIGNKLMMDNSDIAVSFIIKPNLTGDTQQTFISKGDSMGEGYDVHMRLTTKDVRLMEGASIGVVSIPNVILTPGIFYHIVITKVVGTNQGQIYVNGIDVLSFVSPFPFIPNVEETMALGKVGNEAANFYKGTLEAVTISKIIPSSDRIITEFNNLMENDTFYTIGAEENIPDFSTIIPMGYEA